ncbi:hypothetical protein CEXT_726381 [Caerostris extrusa]|uniref:Ycf15 n=1 Tax=Caerostris extrusa TaxID=172846 RepID=A0AAV4XNS3_CAEEX|nr:hypothetical protein CEXT_726381 [Caerostris extrusa]
MSPKRTFLLQNIDILFSLTCPLKFIYLWQLLFSPKSPIFPQVMAHWGNLSTLLPRGPSETNHFLIGGNGIPLFARGSDTPLIIPEVPLSDLPSIMEMHIKIFRKCPQD